MKNELACKEEDGVRIWRRWLEAISAWSVQVLEEAKLDNGQSWVRSLKADEIVCMKFHNQM